MSVNVKSPHIVGYKQNLAEIRIPVGNKQHVGGDCFAFYNVLL